MKFTNDWGNVEFKQCLHKKLPPMFFVSVSGIKGGNEMTGKLTPNEALIVAGYMTAWAEAHLEEEES